ncbi:DUF805 domain-containing protein [Klebsiella oxytoca]|uniref:DUF805 domain-containing protein n=1 Tax=Klebsiella oxytoca TaxID=571 RepID=UPI00292E4601|nr:DUF805 domain-containing protein [Klebsiella oxytoca]
MFHWLNYVLFKNYFNFKGRATRREFWWFCLALFIIAIFYFSIVMLVAPDKIMQSRIVMNIFTIPCYAVTVRRLHDTGRSGWWVLLSFLPFIGSIVLLVFMLEKSEKGINKFGPEAIYEFES